MELKVPITADMLHTTHLVISTQPLLVVELVLLVERQAAQQVALVVAALHHQ